MNDVTFKELSKEEPTAFHKQMLEECRDMVKTSRDKMSNYYTQWDALHETFRARRPKDRQDKEAEGVGIPSKTILPLTQAQSMTFIAFAFLMMTQNRRFYELLPTGVEDTAIREALEITLERDLRVNRWKGVLFQYLLDLTRFGVGIIKDFWVKKYTTVATNVMVADPTMFEAKNGKILETTKRVLCYEGNQIVNISPFRFFPDIAFPLTQWRRGCFVASEDEYSRLVLEGMEGEKKVAGVDHIDSFYQGDNDRRNSRFIAIDLTKPDSSFKNVCVTEIQRIIIPSKWKLHNEGNGERPLGPETYPVKYLIWMANDNRIIRCEPMAYLHDEFTYGVGQFSPDMHEHLNQSLAEVIDALQGIAGWFLNSRVAAVSRTIDNQFIVDPTAIDTASLSNRERFILLKKSAARQDVRRFITQMAVQDTTTNHVNDVNMLINMIQLITGVNDNAMGQFNQGRRSATEARNVMQGAAGRMKTTVDLQWTEVFEPLGQRLATNQRAGMSEATFASIVGMEKAALYPLFRSTPEELVTKNDFFVFEGVLPSEKAFLAQSVQELLGIIMSNPQASVLFNLDPKKMINEIYELRGLSNLSQFGYDPEQLQQMAGVASAANASQPAAGPEAAGGPPGQPPSY